MWTGGTLGTGLSYNDFFLAVLFGNLLLGIYTAFLGYIGAKTGLSTHLLARYSFGVKGSWLPSLLLGGTQVGWFGVGVAMFAIPVSKATGIDANILIAVSGLLMTLTIFRHLGADHFVYRCRTRDRYSGQLLRLAGGQRRGWAGAFKNDSAADAAGFFQRAGAGGGIVCQRRYIDRRLRPLRASCQKRRTDCDGRFFLGNSLMFIFGAAGAAAVGQADISDVMIVQGLLLPAIVVLGLNIWTTNDNALYASGLGFANITGLSSRTLSVVNGIIGTVCALWLYNNFVGWLTFLSSAIPPIGGVIIADYLLNRRRYADFNTVRFIPVNWIAILSVALGIAAGHYVPGIVPVNAVLGGVFSYILLNPLFNRSLAKSPEVSHAEQ